MGRPVVKEDMDALDLNAVDAQVIFHGGCHGCSQQEVEALSFCQGCRYFAPDWNLPSLCNAEPGVEEVVRAKLLEISSRTKLLGSAR